MLVNPYFLALLFAAVTLSPHSHPDSHPPALRRGECWTDSNNLCLNLGSEPRVSLLLRRGDSSWSASPFIFLPLFLQAFAEQFICSFIHSFIKDFLSTHYMPGTVEETGDIAVDKTGENLLLHEDILVE